MLRKFSCLLGISVVLALLTFAWKPPQGVRLPSELRVELRALPAEANILWIDVREQAAYEDGHIPRAYHLDLSNWEVGIEPVLSAWEPGQRLVVYCGGRSCAESYAIAKRLREDYGLEAYFLEGGWEAWQVSRR